MGQIIDRILETVSPHAREKLRPVTRLLTTAENALDGAGATLKPGMSVDGLLPVGETEIRVGDHLYVRRPGYTHHGLYVGNDEVVNYWDGEVRITTVGAFASGKPVCRVEGESRYSPDEIVARARGRLGERKYSLVFNNCEHFALWCRHGDAIEEELV